VAPSRGGIAAPGPSDAGAPGARRRRSRPPAHPVGCPASRAPALHRRPRRRARP